MGWPGNLSAWHLCCPRVCWVKHARRPSRAAPVKSEGQQSETGRWRVVWSVRLEECTWGSNGYIATPKMPDGNFSTCS